MRPLGHADTSLLVPSAGSGTSFRAGAFVFLRVEERLEPGLYRLRAGELSFTARSAAELSAGATLRARVEAAKPALAGGAGLVLRLLPASFGAPGSPGAAGPSGVPGPMGAAGPPSPPGAAAILARLGLPSDPASRLALAALLSEGLKVEPASLQRLRRSILRAPAGAEGERAELAAVLEGKGLAATEAAVEALAAALDSGAGGGDRDGGDRDDGGQAGGGAEESRAGAGGPPEEVGGAAPSGREVPGAPTPEELEGGFERLIDEEDLPAFLASFLEALVQRNSPEAGILGLANHARGREGHWVMLPFRFSLDSVAFRGSLRILFPSMPGGPGRLEARFSAGLSVTTASAWGFSLAMGGTAGPRLRIFPGVRFAEAQSRLSALAKALETCGCPVELAAADAEWGAGGLASREGVAFDA